MEIKEPVIHECPKSCICRYTTLTDRKSVKSLTEISFLVEHMYARGRIKIHLTGGNFVYRFVGKARYNTTIFSLCSRGYSYIDT